VKTLLRGIESSLPHGLRCAAKNIMKEMFICAQHQHGLWRARRFLSPTMTDYIWAAVHRLKRAGLTSTWIAGRM
jgi:hypothetical protein